MEIIVDHVSKTIKKICVLNNVSLRMSGGRIYGLQGANGSGKTMLLRLISGLIRPTSGKIYIDGYQLGENMDFPDSMGLLIENPAFLSGYTGFENLKLLANIQMKIGENDIRDALCKVGLDPNDSRKYRKFSLGMKQRLGIAAAIMENPSLILLDEPFNALDEEGIEQIKQIIVMYRDKGALIVLACHDTNMLENISDKIYHISNGIIQA
jgi:ABC-2 type transport system ATP-binding protein